MVVTSSENGDPSSRRAVNLEVDRYYRDCCLTLPPKIRRRVFENEEGRGVSDSWLATERDR